MSLSHALEADRAGEIECAATHYEEVLASGDRSLRVLMKLALLYWQATDPGLAAGKKLTREFLAIAGRRVPELLEEAGRRFPENAEVQFWARYIAWADLDQPFTDEECRQLLRDDPTRLLPAMRLFVVSDGRDAETETRGLLRQCREDGTTGARYVVSVIEGVMRRAGLQEGQVRMRTRGERPVAAKSPDDIKGFEFDWLGVDGTGCVALFSTAGAGYAPPESLADTDLLEAAIDAILALPASTQARFAPVLSEESTNTWRMVAERGLFAFDADILGGPYVLVAAPEHPVRAEYLPAIVAKAVAGLEFRHLFFAVGITEEQLRRGR